MRRGTLLTQVLLVNLLLIAAAVVAASIATNPDTSLQDGGTMSLVLGFALAAAVAINVYLLSRRFEPLEDLVEEMESADLPLRIHDVQLGSRTEGRDDLSLQLHFSTLYAPAPELAQAAPASGGADRGGEEDEL